MAKAERRRFLDCVREFVSDKIAATAEEIEAEVEAKHVRRRGPGHEYKKYNASPSISKDGLGLSSPRHGWAGVEPKERRI